MTQDVPMRETVSLTPTEGRLILCCVLTTMFLSVLDQTIVATSLPSIASDFGNFSLISWVITAYLLTSSCVVLVVGKFSDLYGRQIVLRACLITFIVSSVLCAIAPNLLFLIGARLLQGLGGGALVTLAQTIISDIVAPRERARYSAYFSITWGAGAALGPLLGGLLTQYMGWPFIFWINLPLGLAALVLADRTLGKLPVYRRRSSINYASILTLSGATVALLLVLSLGGKRLPWSSWHLLALALLSIVLSTIFIWQQMRSDEPILPPHFFKDRVIRPALFVNFALYGGFFTIVSLTPIFFQVVQQQSISRSGLLMIPLMIGMTIASFGSGKFIKRTGRYKPPPRIGLPVAAIAAALTALSVEHVAAPIIALILGGYGIGMGLSLPSCQIAAQNAVDPRDMGAVNGSITFSRVLGGSLGIALGTAIVLGYAAASMPPSGEALDIETLTRQVLAPETRHAIADSFQIVFAGVAGMTLIGLAIFSRMEERALRQGSRAEIVPTTE